MLVCKIIWLTGAGQIFSVYILAGQVSKLLHGEHLSYLYELDWLKESLNTWTSLKTDFNQWFSGEQ